MVKLKLTEDQLNGLHYAVNEARKGSEYIKVNKAALSALLIDHGAVLSTGKKRAFDYTTTEAKGDAFE